jgi:hypothetical protein
VGIVVDGVKVTSHLIQQIWLHIRVVNNKSISKTAVNGMIQPETALTGKDSSLDTCLLDLSSKLKHQFGEWMICAATPPLAYCISSLIYYSRVLCSNRNKGRLVFWNSMCMPSLKLLTVPSLVLSRREACYCLITQFCIHVFFSFGLSICFDNELSGFVCR